MQAIQVDTVLYFLLSSPNKALQLCYGFVILVGYVSTTLQKL